MGLQKRLIEPHRYIGLAWQTVFSHNIFASAQWNWYTMQLRNHERETIKCQTIQPVKSEVRKSLNCLLICSCCGSMSRTHIYIYTLILVLTWLLCAHLDKDKAALSNDWKCRNYKKRFVTTVKVVELEQKTKKSLNFHKNCFFHAKYMKEKKEKTMSLVDRINLILLILLIS